MLVEVFYQGIASRTSLKLYGAPLEGKCPSTYGPAKPCFYVAHSFSEELLVAGGVEKVGSSGTRCQDSFQVTVHLGSRKVSLAVKEINKRLESGLTMCVQPVYYYSQWQNIVLYVEAWRAQGASRIIVFYHSATRETRQVLEYYQNLVSHEILILTSSSFRD